MSVCHEAVAGCFFISCTHYFNTKCVVGLSKGLKNVLLDTIMAIICTVGIEILAIATFL